MKRLAEIARRREELSARAAAQREAVAFNFHQLERPLGVVDRVFGAAYLVRAHPFLFGAGVSVFVALLRGKIRLLRTLGRAMAAWRVWRMVAGLLALRRGSRETVSR